MYLILGEPRAKRHPLHKPAQQARFSASGRRWDASVGEGFLLCGCVVLDPEVTTTKWSDSLSRRPGFVDHGSADSPPSSVMETGCVWSVRPLSESLLFRRENLEKKKSAGMNIVTPARDGADFLIGVSGSQV